MTGPDLARATRVSLETARRYVTRAALALGVIYAAFTVYYLLFPNAPGASTLAAVTGPTAAVLIGAGLWRRNHECTTPELYVWAVALALVILFNVNAALYVSGDYLFAVSHMFAQLGAAILTPTLLLFAVFTVLNVASCFSVLVVAHMAARWDLGVLGFVMTIAVSVLLLFARFRNISMMDALREAVEENRDHDFREIIDKNPDAVVLLRGTTIIYANARWSSLLRVDASELCGKDMCNLLVEGRDSLDQVMARDRIDPSCVVKVSRRDGEVVLLDVAEPKIITFEDAPATMLVARDVTASQEALAARLLIADRMSAAGTLAAGVAHEINNPLMYVSTNLAVLRDELTNSDTAAYVNTLLDEIKDGVDRVAVIVKDLGAVSRIEEDTSKAVDPIAALRTATKMVDNQLRHRTEVVCNLRPLPRVRANEGKLVQTFVNILINSAHAIDEAGRPRNRITITSRQVGDNAVVQIADTGCGMTDETRQRVFDPFFTTKDQGKGTGLGMYFCHDVVRSCGGSIEIESTKGSGTTVRLVLPAATSNTGRFKPVQKKRAPTANGLSPMRVLVVDDEPFVAKAIARVLKAYDVTVTNSGEQAIREFEQHRHDLVLCDIMMPGISGPQVYERLLELDPSVERRVMFMTGGAFTPRAREFAVAHEERVLKKPVAVDSLLEVARTAAKARASERRA